MKRTIKWILLVLIGFSPAVAFSQVNATVEVTGISGEELQNVMLLLSIEQQKSDSLLSAGRLQRLHRKAPQEIKQALEPFGYYRTKIESSLKETETGWLARYQIDPGPPLPVAEIDVNINGEAANDPAFRKLLDSPPLVTGETFNHSIYEQWKRDLRRLAEERGYFDARFDRHRVRIDLDAYNAKIELLMESGPRYRFGPVNIVGDLLVNESLVRRYITFKEDDPYSASKMLQLQEGLYGSDYFSRVDIRTERNKAKGLQVPVSLHLVMNKRTRYQIGLGYGTDTGPRGSIGYDRRYLNRSGHRFSAKLGISEIEDSLSADYVIPLKRPISDRAIIRSEYSRSHTEDIDSTALTVGAGVEKTRGEWFRSYFLNFQMEEFNIGVQSGNARLLMPTLNWLRLSTNDVLNTVRGSRTGLKLRGARNGWGSNTSLAQAHLNGKFIRSVGDGRFLLRGELGTSWAPEFVKIPPSVRFFAGGDNSVRGYAYQSLGPEDAEGNVIGGKHLLTTSIEYEHRLGEKWRAAVFIDAGNAFADYQGELEQGAGIGLRRRLPIGWLRIDVAQAITDEDKPWRLHITLGPDL